MAGVWVQFLREDFDRPPPTLGGAALCDVLVCHMLALGVAA